MATYTVYVLSYKTIPVFYEQLYVEEEAGKGWLYHVERKDGTHWKYGTKEGNKVERSKIFYGKYARGTIAQADLERVDLICREIAVPKDEWREGIRSRRDCRHWVRTALAELEKQGVLQPDESTTAAARQPIKPTKTAATSHVSRFLRRHGGPRSQGRR
ncbi:hypothetical protein LTR99_003893 [Exophiala xenobiotica]|uniref:Uncharacterized protein n=1 Tax=Vermiconidia calcicola TaxID=1690605 RepID=A0AAV9PUG5_9PEZI|nr:hypothetical protein H2202_002566 [Exophiala xenobiotica]KAK5529788.1 hypothetical protein LTR25_009567 [Vermiconidia calcicola]KAK5549007.1 hypothetical protein LTR23_000837 [Chaetothyriales sp. CCFEE 6169]KAK5190388.1 hypothetical protein LTR92_009790 [Exophiala xenobiotica]KAK5205094.1 hypothetical protein LTR41_009304 [Exophiala xenobiotica]